MIDTDRGRIEVLQIEVHIKQRGAFSTHSLLLLFSPQQQLTMKSEPSRETMRKIFILCRTPNKWTEILRLVKENPLIATTTMIMDNHIATTILHQAITSKSNTEHRARVISHVLATSPKAATIKNGYGSLPLHVIMQRNTKMNSRTKERLVHEMIAVYPEALIMPGGVGLRTPVHIAFTDYISPGLARMLIDRGTNALFLKDKKGWLPLHVAISRHCSPEKLHMLLKANPESLHAKTDLGESLLDLAKTTATQSHPNYALVAELKKCYGGGKHEEAEPIAFKPPRRATRKRKAEAAELLLNFSRQHDPTVPYELPTPVRVGAYPTMYHHPRAQHYPIQERIYQGHYQHLQQQRRQQVHRHRQQQQVHYERSSRLRGGPRALFQPKYPGHYVSSSNHQQENVGETAQV